MYFSSTNKDVDVKDIYAMIQMDIFLFGSSDEKTDAPLGCTEGSLFLLKDGTLHFSSEKNNEVLRDYMCEKADSFTS